VDAITLLMYRMLMALPFFVLMAWWGGRGRPALRRDERWAVLGLGFCGYYLASMLDFVGLQHISAGLERLILYLTPTLVLVYDWAWRGRPITPGHVLATLVSYGGALLVFGFELHAAPGGATAWGALWVLGSAASYALYLFFSGQFVRRIGALRLVGLASTVASLCCIAHFALVNPLDAAHVAEPVLWLSLLNATLCTAAPVLLVMLGVERIGAGLAAQVGMIGPLSTIAMGVLLGEPFTGPGGGHGAGGGRHRAVQPRRPDEFETTRSLNHGLGIAGKWALVCGASKGLGLGCAQALARGRERGDGGARRRGAGRRQRAARRGGRAGAAGGGRHHHARGARGGVGPALGLRHRGHQRRRPMGNFRDWDRAAWIKAVDANMLTPIELIKATLDGMLARGFGRIVNITSSAVKAPIDVLGLSNGARSGLTGFIAGLARNPQVAAQGVTINNLLPGKFDTDRLAGWCRACQAKRQAGGRGARRAGRAHSGAALRHAGRVRRRVRLPVQPAGRLPDGAEHPARRWGLSRDVLTAGVTPQSRCARAVPPAAMAA
jgi:drug/metabolite transporter (DMT)-like permease/NAD(P)-dependent dehydrogenase (short-subunit alcohol dehydrogenase family)